MNFRTNITLQKENNQIDYGSKLLLIGSCFSENISEKLKYFKFQVQSNPFGILYNPKAIENLIAKAINNTVYTDNDIFNLNERWHCFDAHSDLSTLSNEDLIKNLNITISNTHQQIKDASHIIITLGTSWVYRYIETNTIVGNCHKIPQKKFLKELLTVNEVFNSLKNIQNLISTINSTVQIIFTVSPVRHIKDGFIENSQSKAHLIAAIHQVISNTDNAKTAYFPSYEIMLDDLRDYRFYANDMIHPNDTAINYIWEQFLQVWIHEKTASIQKEVDSIQKGLAHKPFNPLSKEHQKFKLNLQQKMASLKKDYHILF